MILLIEVTRIGKFTENESKIEIMKNLYFTGYLTGRVSAWVLKTVLQTDGGDVVQQCECFMALNCTLKNG